MDVLIPLDAPEARDREVAGGKAAGLAALRACGLPVASGWVVPAGISERAVAIGAEVFIHSGAAAARLAMSGAPVDDALLAELDERARGMGARVVVRSSFVDEADPRWSGAFASYLDVAPDDLGTALRGCWASLFSRDVEERCARLGGSVVDLRMAVLIQPHLPLRSGGLARVSGDGRVVVSMVPASPAGLMAGRRTGNVVEVDPDGVCGGPGAPGQDVRSVARLAMSVRETTGDDTIEWGTTASGAVFVLQASRAASVVDASRSAIRHPVEVPPAALAVVAKAARFPGALGEELVLTWAVALDHVPDPEPVAVTDAARALAEVRSAAEALAAETWGLPAPEAVRTSHETFARLRAGDPAARASAVERIAALRPVDAAAGAAVLGMLDGIAHELERADVLASAELAWHVEPGELERAVACGGRPKIAAGPDRWEPLLVDVVAAHGVMLRGEPVSPGVGAGAVRVIGPRWYADPPARRQVLVAAYPSPHLAPLLWGCAGLVTAEGSLGAHLFEVARALGVPVVAGVTLPAGARRDGTIAAVDGDAGTVGVRTAPAERATAGAGERTRDVVGGGP